MVAIVSAHADDLGRSNRRQQVSCANWSWLEVETPRGRMSVGQPKSQILFGSSDKVDDPRLAAAFFHRAINDLAFESKAAVFHWEFSLRAAVYQGLGTVSSVSTDRGL